MSLSMIATATTTQVALTQTHQSEFINTGTAQRTAAGLGPGWSRCQAPAHG